MATPDYYSILEIDSTATSHQIREAYKKAALKHHPDRVPADSPERPKRTKKFQQINDAYYTLSDPARRREYDRNRGSGGFGGAGVFESDEESVDEEIPASSGARAGGSSGGFPFSSFFGGAGGSSAEAPPTGAERARDNDQFGSVFEEMLREEGMAEGQDNAPTNKFWSIVGGLSGGAMGFIIANFPGAVAGAVAGNRLGAVRDAKGKSVYSVFLELPRDDRSKLLADLAAKVFAHAIS